ncbi:Nucleotidyltransferase domain protein [uncultured archaeon]|nr:Nucleotidyltransferase domain protein [uncultured archaeon]
MLVGDILDSKSKAALFERLVCRSASFSVSDLSRLSGLSKPTVSGVVIEWEGAGLVSCEQQGRNKMVSLNKGFYLLPELRAMFSKANGRQGELIKRLESVEALGSKEIAAVIVFGSRARNDFIGKSDLDVLVVLGGKSNRIPEDAVESLVEVSAEMGVKYSPTFISREELLSRARGNDIFIKNILAEGKVIKGADFIGNLQRAP